MPNRANLRCANRLLRQWVTTVSTEKTQVRVDFNAVCLVRDNYRCRACGRPLHECKLNVHHITPRDLMPFGGYVLENGITLCEDTCHLAAERFLQRRRLTGVEGGLESGHFAFGEANLYRLIGSSYQAALDASAKLGSSR